MTKSKELLPFVPRESCGVYCSVLEDISSRQIYKEIEGRFRYSNDFQESWDAIH